MVGSSQNSWGPPSLLATILLGSLVRPSASFLPSSSALGRIGGCGSTSSMSLRKGVQPAPLYVAETAPLGNRGWFVLGRRSSGVSVRSGPSPPPSPPPENSMSKAEQADLNFALWDASKNGETSEVEKLVRKGANVNYYDPEMLQATALHWAANNGHEDTVRKLIEMGASVMPTNQFGWTAIHHAANWGYAGVVKALIDLGADPNSTSESGKTPAQCASFKGFNDVVDVITAANGLAEGLITDGGAETIKGFQQQVFRATTKDFDVWLPEWDKPAKKMDL